ncbi:hypothetical protein ACSBR2_011273 [Camellia fascicularis]
MSFLRVADAIEENDPELKVWVNQVREAAYDIGDVLDLFMLRLGHRHGHGFCGFLHKVSYFIKTSIARHQIASEVQRMKSKVDNISEGHQRYHDRYGMLERGSSSRSTGFFNKARHDCRGDALLLDEAELENIYGEFLPLIFGRAFKSYLEKMSNVDEWDKINRSLGAELGGNDKLLSMKKILSLSYFDLPYYLKFCFLYPSVFPEDYLIEHRKLIRLWVAEGFVEMKAGMTTEEVVEDYLNELINRSIVQVAQMRSDGRRLLLRRVIHQEPCVVVLLPIANQQLLRLEHKCRSICPGPKGENLGGSRYPMGSMVSLRV